MVTLASFVTFKLGKRQNAPRLDFNNIAFAVRNTEVKQRARKQEIGREGGREGRREGGREGRTGREAEREGEREGREGGKE